MAWVKLPITGDPYRNLDESELDHLSAYVQDCIVNEAGHTVKRPGLDEFVDTTVAYGVDGLYWWDEQSMAIVVTGGRVFKITDQAGTNAEITSTSELQIGTPVSFATDGTTLVMSNGGKMVTTDGATLTDMADGDAPTTVRNVAYIDTYLLAQVVGGSTIQRSDVGAITAWTAGSQFQMNATPDDITTMRVGWREIIGGGPRSMEIWYNDGITPFRRMESGAIETGILAPDSLMQVGNQWMWFSNKREFVVLDGRTPTSVAFPFARQLQSMAVVDNAKAFVMYPNGYPLYIINFPSGDRTFCYHIDKKTWSEWGKWNSTRGEYNQYAGQTACYCNLWNLHLVGDRQTGVVYKADRSYYDDDGTTIRSVRRTGWITHGTMSWKRCSELRLRCKRPTGDTTTTDPLMMVRWRDENGAWGNEHHVSMGPSGDGNMMARLTRLGRYRMRQYEFVHTDPVEWVLMDGEENIEILEEKA